ncbi:adenosine kinase, partial [Paragonimus westermani]
CNMELITDGYFLGLGNPLLDMIATVDDALLKVHSLKMDDAILAEPRHLQLYEELKQRFAVKYVAGGAALNTTKMIQWILWKPHKCTYIGCIASDEAGDLLRNECEKLQLCTKFQIIQTDSGTGRCAVLLQGGCRSMVTHLGAAQNLTLDYVLSGDVWQYVNKARVYYIAAFAINSCFDGVLMIARQAHCNQKLFCFNLSAPFLQTYFADKVDAVLPYVDILFGNKDEALAYADKHSLGTQSLSSIARHLANLSPADGVVKNRIVVLTRGKDSVIVATTSEMDIKTFPAIHLDDKDIVDTNGAGDAFAAGFISAYVLSNSIDEAIALAMKSACHVIQRTGFTLGPREKFDFHV